MRSAFFTVWTMLLPLLAGGAETQAPGDSHDIEELMAGLADPDSAVRERAAQRLAALGAAARPQIIEASRGDNPEQRAQAARILGQLPWATDDDPPDVRDLLQRYGDANDMTRASVISRLYELRASATLVRLLGEEPSDLVRWMIVWALSDLRDSETQATLRQLKPDDDDAPALVTAGRAWIERDRAKALRYLRRAIDIDASRPTNDIGMLDFAYEQLIAAAMETRDFEQAAALLRRQVPRDLVPRRVFPRLRRGTSESLPRLLALHEYLGPLRHYAWDCQTWGINVAEQPRLLDTISTRLAWLGFTPPLRIGLTSGLTMVERYRAGSFLDSAELSLAADLELDAAAQMLDSSPDRRGRIIRGRDSGREDVQEMLCELPWRRARAAHAAGDRAAAEREIERFIDLNPGNTDSAIRIILWLKETDRKDQAAELFDRIYNAGRERIERATSKAGYRNDLAWLCARTGEKLDEALALAQQAVDEMPEMAAFLDTLAEAKYRTGQREEAIALEQRALQLSPDTKFMKEQLERFQAGRP